MPSQARPERAFLFPRIDMRNLLFAAALIAGCSQSVTAGNIASDASGVYVGSDRACRIVLRNHPVSVGSKVVELSCLQFNGWPTNSLVTIWAPNDCIGQAALLMNPGSGQAPEYLSIRTYGSQSISIIRGSIQVGGGIGVSETWQRIGNAPSPSPFSCPAPQWLYKLPW